MSSAPATDLRTRIAALRAELARRGLAGFVVPRTDEYQNEYVPPSSERLAWLTGFTGSAGLAVVLADAGAVFTDGRYTLQVREQVPEDLLEVRHITDEPYTDWIAARLGAGERLGFDPWLHTEGERRRLEDAVGRAGGELVAVDDNPVDAVWTDRPAPPAAPIVPHDVVYAGESAADKRARCAEALRRNGRKAAVVTAPDSIAWLLNVRGGDVAHTPLPLAFAVLHDDARVDLFVDPAKPAEGLDAHFGDAVSLAVPDDFLPALDALGASGATVQADPSVPVAIRRRLEAAGAQIVEDRDPCVLLKARKNAVELTGSRAAHARDAVALCRFLAWLDAEAPGGGVGEIAAGERLLAFRRELDLFREESFPTISGAGPNGAIVHYRVTPESERKLEPGSLYLVDSGAQFLDGTTDVTRTIAIGEPADEMRERFTLVLKGHIAISTAVFPKGTTGGQIDAFARRALWERGLDFDHGTGHGVGSFLSVHEGPQRISKRGGDVALEPGMILSNEPGYYKAGAYGIRIENLVAVREVAVVGGERDMLGFEILTLAPIDRCLVVPGMMTASELAWLDAYHARVLAEVGPRLGAEVCAWLEDATAPLAP